MTTVTAQKRDMNIKAKKLRREGFVPGIVCGREIKEQKAIQIAEKEAQRVIRENKKGEKVILKVEDETFNAIIKDYSRNGLTNQIESLDFQALVKGEKINTSVEIILKNEDKIEGIVTQEISEVHYKADSDHLVDTIVLDFEKLKGVKSMKVADLDVFKDPNVIVANPDTVIFSVTQASNMPEEAEAAPAEEQPATEVKKEEK